MRYLTHQFAHSETLERARRWLMQAGVSADRMEVQHHGIPRLAVVAEPAEIQSIEMIIRIAELNDPDGLPGFWDLARLRADEPEPAEPAVGVPAPPGPRSFPLAWHAMDVPADEPIPGQIERPTSFREMRP